jgi:RNA polymerase sigma-70 factor (ECF subfamily)
VPNEQHELTMTDELDRIYERVLVVRAQAGDRTALVEIVGIYQPRLAYFVRKLVPERVDDLLQDVWLDVVRHLPRLADPAAFQAWVYRIARDRAFGLLRQTRRDAEPLLEIDVPEDLESDEFDAEDAAQIHAGLDRLTPEQREVLVLRFLEAMSYEAIAAATGLAVGTVRSRLFYAKRVLRAVLENELATTKPSLRNLR